MVCGRAAPARVDERLPDRVEGRAAVVRGVDRVAAIAVGVLVALVSEVEDVAVAVRGHPRAVVDGLAGRQQRPVLAQHVLAEPVDVPARERDVADVRVDEVEMVGVVDGHVSLVAEVVLLERQHGQPGQVGERLAAVA